MLSCTNGYERPDDVNLIYINHLIDMNIGYNLISKGRLDFDIFTGIQARRISSGNIKSAYGGIYNPFETENIIPSQKIQLSDIRFGSAVQYALHKSFGLTLQYNLAIPLEVESIKWPKRHQFELGLTYHLN